MGNKKRGYSLITAAGVLWGMMFLFAQYLLDNGLTSQDLVSWKLFVAFLIMIVYVLIKDKNLLKVDKRGLIIMMIMGLVSHSVYNLVIFLALDYGSVATAVSLLYTNPIFVMVLSRIIFKENFNAIKITSLFICILGVFLTVTGGEMAALSFNRYAIIFGLISGLCFAATNIFSKFLVGGYEQVTILTYTFGFGFLFSLSFSDPLVPFRMEFDPFIWMNILLLGIVPTAVSYALFTRGLANGVESSKASIITTIEVPISVLGSYLIFGQNIGGWEIVGIILVIGSVILLQRDNMPTPRTELQEKVQAKT